MDRSHISPRFAGSATLSLTGCRPHDFPQYPPDYREYVYVTNGESGTVTVLDAVNLRVDREVAVGQHPVAAAASSAGNEVYVVNAGASGGQGSISVINAETNTVVGTVPVRGHPVSIDLEPHGDLGYVANSSSNTISIVDLKARREIAVIGAGEEPVEARVSPDGKTLVIPNRAGNSVSLAEPGLAPGKRSRGLRGLPRRIRRGHSSRFFQGIHRLRRPATR